MKKKVFERLKQNRLLGLVFGVQLLMLACLVALALKPQCNYVITGADLTWMDGPETTVTEDGCQVFTPVDEVTDSYTYRMPQNFVLTPGAYEIVVEYEVIDSKVDIAEYVALGGGVPRYGTIKCVATEEYETGISASDVILYHGKTQAVGRVWNSVSANLSDVNVYFSYNNNATIVVKSVVIEEQLVYRVARIIGFLLVCTVLNLLLWMLTDSERDWHKRYILLGLVTIVGVASMNCFADYIFNGTDLDYHLLRIGALAEELKNGQFPVRLQTDAVNAAGYITPVFYSDLFLYIPAILYLMMVPLQTCYQIYMLLINVATVASSYICFSKMFRSKEIGILGTVLYVFASDRLHAMLVGASVGKYTALVFLPLIALGIYNILEAKGRISFRQYLPLILGLTGIIQSHILTCEMIVAFAVLFFLIHIKEFIKKEQLLGILKAGVLTVFLNLFFLLPFLMSWMMDINVKTQEGNIKAHGAYPMQLFSLFPELNGWSNAGTMQGDAAVSVGVALAIGGVVFLLCMMRSKEWGIETNRAYIYGKRCMGYGVLALFMCTVYFPWEVDLGPVSDVLSAVQFPHRYLEIATITLTITSLCAVKLLWMQKGKLYAGGVSVVLLLFTAITTGYFYSNAGNMLSAYHVYTYQELNTMNMGGGSEYIPGEWADVVMLTDGKPVTEDEDVTILEYSKDGMVTTLRCENAGEEAYVELPLFCYDNYVVRDADTEEAISYQKNDMSVMEILIPAGYAGSIEIFYQAPVIWRVAEVISLITAIAMIGYACIFQKIKGKS